jgi:hypothetical protein
MANGTDTPPPQPTATPPPPGDTGGGGGRKAGLIALVVVLIAGAGVAGYFIGDSAADASKAKTEGRAAGEAAARAPYRPGAPGYVAIFRAGQASGTRTGHLAGVRLGAKQGQAAGFERGKSTGKAQGVADGAAAALGGYTSWQTGTGGFYIVDPAPGTQTGIPYVINGRQLMQPNRLYEICTDDPARICSEAAPPK